MSHQPPKQNKKKAQHTAKEKKSIMLQKKRAEVPAAFIERKPGAEVSAQELMDFCRREIAGFKVPRQVRFITEWPMSASKIQKFRLRDELVRELGV